MKTPELSPAEQATLDAGQHRSPPFKALRARLADLRFAPCLGQGDQAPHVVELETPIRPRCPACRRTRGAAQRANQAANETFEQYLERRERKNQSNRAWVAAHPEAAKAHEVRSSLMSRIKRLLRLADNYAGIMRRSETSRVELTRLAGLGLENLVASPDPYFPVTAAPGETVEDADDARLVSLALIGAGLRPDGTNSGGRRMEIYKLSGEMRALTCPRFGPVKRFFSKQVRLATGIESVTKFPHQHLADVLHEIARLDQDDVSHARHLINNTDPVEEEAGAMGMSVEQVANLERVVAGILKQGRAAWRKLPAEERAAIIAKREDFLRSLKLITSEEWDELFHEERAEFFENQKRVERGQQPLPIDASLPPTDRPHPDALRLLPEEETE